MYTFCCSQMKQVSVQRASHWKFYLQSIFSPVIKLHPILTFGIWLEGFGSTHCRVVAGKKKSVRQWNFVKNGNFLVFGLQLENEERYRDGSNG